MLCVDFLTNIATKSISDITMNSDDQWRKYPTVGFDYWTNFGNRLVELMEINAGAKVLDVGTGSGACLIAAAKKIGSTGKIIGIDSWEKILAETTENIWKFDLANASVQKMDAEDMTFEDNSFDCVLCGFIGFDDVFDFEQHKYKEQNKKMNEIIRVLKKGGKAGFSTWELQEDIQVLGELARKYLTEEASENPKKMESIPTGYSKETTEGFEKLMADAGFQNIKIVTEKFDMVYRNEEEWWKTMSEVGWDVLSRTIGSESKALQDFKEKMLLDGLQDYKRDNGICFTKSVIFAFGTK
ncbi:MAG: class I SAM-dependent methyltransferase [Promethearchaeota archaeon]